MDVCMSACLGFGHIVAAFYEGPDTICVKSDSARPRTRQHIERLCGGSAADWGLSALTRLLLLLLLCNARKPLNLHC